MGILAAFMVPHPPLIVPDIGRGNEKQIEETINSYEAVAEEIAALAPETIIITSPHSVMYADYFHISPGKKAAGDFGNFGAGNVRFSEEYDSELVKEISDIADLDGFPAGTLGEKDKSLDHGTLVPLYFIRKHYSGGRIVRIGLSGQPLTDHYQLGIYIKEAVERLCRRAVFVASGDLSHKLQDYGPYGYAEEGPEYDRRIMEAAGKADFSAMLDFDEDFCDSAAECGHRSFVIMAGAFDGMAVSAKVCSHQDVTGVGYGICSFYPTEKDDSRHFLGKRLEKLSEANEACDGFVKLARASMESYIRYGNRLRVPDGIPREILRALPRNIFTDRAGAFVSIHKNGQLRGCIGTIAPTARSLAQEIVNNAISASTRDPRFSPITEDELKWLEINVDVLGKPEDISSRAELDVKRYGVIVSCGARRGLLLPDLEGIDDVDTQVSIAMQKGGITERDNYSLQRFEVIRHK